MGKILFITGFFPFYQGGAEYQAFLLAEYLSENHQIFFVFRDHWHKSNGEKIEYGNFVLYPIRPIKIKGVNKPYIFESYQLYQLIKKISPDIIYVRGANAYLGVAASYAIQHNCKLVWHIASDGDVKPLKIHHIKFVPFDFFDYCAVQYGMNRANYIIAQTRHQGNLFYKLCNRACDAVIGNWHPVPLDCVKQKDNIIVLWIANWKSVKQPEVFVRLASELGGNQNARFIMLGRTDRYKELVEKAKKNDVEVMGEIANEQVNELLARSHILVNTSQQEGFSNTFIQAWLRRVSVVSLQVDPDNILQREQIGFCSGSFEKLVQDTKRLITDQKLRDNMGDKAREYAMKHHSLHNMKQMLQVFSGLMGESSDAM